MHGETSYAKMAVVCICPASSGAVAPIILQVLRVTLFATLGSDFHSGGMNQEEHTNTVAVSQPRVRVLRSRVLEVRTCENVSPYLGLEQQWTR